ncbi:N-acetylmuramoyl-L-alanine amidase [Carnobacterium maltaromaticum]|uniref:N-acetylmuramoyl-L-alanine amidase n=1 Tax=Carnobacterium maltaromaticum TaxID=2751 RepID=UPI0039BE03B3
MSLNQLKKIDSLSGNQSTIESSTVVKEENITEQKESTDEEIGSQETDAKEKETINKEEISNVQYINSVTLPQLLGEENIKEFQEVGNGSLAIKGWALADVGMYAVEILIDGKVVDRASLGEERLDIYNQYPAYNSKNSGYSYQLNTSGLSNGNHKITIKAIAQGGKSIAKDIQIVKKTLPQLLGEENIKEFQEVGNGSLAIKGWALADVGMYAVEILIDGKVVDRASLGEERLDIYNQYPAYNSKNSGYSYQLNTSGLSNGNHKITIKAIAQGGKSIAKDIQIVKKTLPQLLGEENIKEFQEVGNGSLAIKGWALADVGMYAVEILIDGKVVDRASLGEERLDIYNQYPAYNSKNSGYSYQLNTSGLSNGNHKITIKAIAQGGKSIAKDIQIVKKNLPQLLNVDALEQNQQIIGKKIIKGWALADLGIYAVEIIVDGQFESKAIIGEERMDVYQHYPAYSNKNAGFSYELDTSRLSTGVHKITFKAIEQGGKSIAKDIFITAGFPHLLIEENVVANQFVKDTLDISGWSLNEKGIYAVEIIIDGKIVGKANYGLERIDINHLYPYYNNKNSGFKYTLNTSALSNGKHTLTLKSIAQGGKSIAKDIIIRKGELEGKVIVVDAGHGGHDPGAVAFGVKEKVLNLDVALKVQRNLAELGAQVIMTRTDDSFIPLNQIAAVANNSKADLFISIHHNSATPTAFGIETYYYNSMLGKSFNDIMGSERYQSLKELDMERNIEIIKNYNYLGNTWQRTEDSKQLANQIQSGMISETGAYNRQAKHGDFHVIRETKMPAILAELGFITNPAEVNNLVSDAYQEKLARGILNGVKNYFK